MLSPAVTIQASWVKLLIHGLIGLFPLFLLSSPNYASGVRLVAAGFFIHTFPRASDLKT